VEFTKQHRHYLQNRKFTVRTDHAPLRSILKTKDPEGQLARWVAFLSTLNFDIVYRQGSSHINAYAMSRNWHGRREKIEPSRTEIGTQTESEEHDGLQEKKTKSTPVVETQPNWTSCSTVKLQPTWTSEYLKDQQMQDNLLQSFIQLKRSNEKRPQWEDVSDRSPALKSLWTQWDRLEFRDGVLYRRWESDKGSRQSYVRECFMEFRHTQKSETCLVAQLIIHKLFVHLHIKEKW